MGLIAMSITDSLNSNIKNKVLNSSIGKLLKGKNWMETSSGNNFIPEYTKTDGQKKFSSSSAIPNLVKPETMFFVYFNINANAQNLIMKKRKLIEHLSMLQLQEIDDLNVKHRETEKELWDTGFMSDVSKKIDEKLTALSDMFTKVKDTFNLNEKAIADTDTSTSNQTADYIPDKMILRQLSFELSKMVKSITKPSIRYKINEYNEYNRKRLCYDNREYTPITIDFYDAKENPVQQFFFSYLKMIDDTFLCKTSSNYKKPIYTTKWDTIATDWGFNLDSNFRLIDSISIIEMYMDKMMVYTLENPVLESIDFGSNVVGSYKPNEIKVTFQYEGITNDLLVGEYAQPVEPYTNVLDDSNNKIYLKSMINSHINGDIATFIQKRYKSGTAATIDTASAFIKGILDAPKAERWDKVKSQLLDTGRKLGFSNEINMAKQAETAIENLKKSDDKSQYMLKLSDDPSSIVGTMTASSVSTSDNSILGLF